MEWENVQRLTKRRLEREQGRRDVTEDMSEDLSEGEKGEGEKGEGEGEKVQSETQSKDYQRNSSNLEVWTDDNNKERRLYLVLIRSFL